MKYLLDHKQMKAIDVWSIQRMGIPSLVLMERASLAVAKHLRARIDKNTKLLAVCGTGNNGADAVAAARILYNEGYDASVCLILSNGRFSDELNTQIEIAKNLGMTILDYEDVNFNRYDWLIDGIFGIGLSRNIEGHYADVIEEMNMAKGQICAVDIPSGIFADNGQILGRAVKADMTVTFGYDKAGTHIYPGASYAGELFVEDIGFARNGIRNVSPSVFMLEEEDVRKQLPPRYAWSNKGSYGKLLVIAGSKNMAGACILSARAGYRMGTGLVKVMTPEVNREIIQNQVPEAVLYTYDEQALNTEQIEAQIDWADAVVVGPGMGKEPHVLMILKAVLNTRKPVLIDADGLNVLAEHMELLENRRGHVILTPHLGEMSRLIGMPVQKIKADPITICRDFAAKYHVVLVMKDAKTVISDGEMVWVNGSGNEGMSTGGSGDVLSGIIGGLICQSDMEYPGRLAATGTMIHGMAGDEAKKIKGTYGLLASDIIEYMTNILG